MKGKTNASGVILTTNVCQGELSCKKKYQLLLETTFEQNDFSENVVQIIKKTTISPQGASHSGEHCGLARPEAQMLTAVIIITGNLMVSSLIPARSPTSGRSLSIERDNSCCQG